MLSTVLTIVGAILFLPGLFFLSLLLVAPFKNLYSIVINRRDDNLLYETRLGKRILARKKKEYIRLCQTAITLGGVLLLVGIFTGYADRDGGGYFLYKKLGGKARAEQQLDNINEQGKYVDDAGQEFTNYVIVDCTRGTSIKLNGDEYETPEAFENELKRKVDSKEIDKGNRMILVDRFAVSDLYHRVRDILTEYGFEYSEEIR